MNPLDRVYPTNPTNPTRRPEDRRNRRGPGSDHPNDDEAGAGHRIRRKEQPPASPGDRNHIIDDFA